MKIIRIFHLKIFIFLVIKFAVCLNRRVFVMRFMLFGGVTSFILEQHLHLRRLDTHCEYLACELQISCGYL